MTTFAFFAKNFVLQYMNLDIQISGRATFNCLTVISQTDHLSVVDTSWDFDLNLFFFFQNSQAITILTFFFWYFARTTTDFTGFGNFNRAKN